MSYYTSYLDKNSNPKPITALVHVPTKTPEKETEKPAEQAPIDPKVLTSTEPEPEPLKKEEPETSADEPPTEKPSPKTRSLGKTAPYLANPVIISFLVIGISLAFSGFIFYKYSQPQGKLSQPATLGAQDSTKKILDDVAKIMVIPADQTPTIATVTNVEKLRATQPFFNAAKNGDKLLIFADKAILYRPDENKIVDIGPVNRPSEATPEADTKPALLPTTEPVSPTSTPKPKANPTEATTSAR